MGSSSHDIDQTRDLCRGIPDAVAATAAASPAYVKSTVNLRTGAGGPPRYYYPYRPGITVGFYAGFGFGYPYYYGAYPYPYPYYGAYGYPYPYGGYPYAASGYGPPAPQNYVSAQPGVAYGGVRIEGAPKDAQVFADGNYVGVVEDFDGPVRHLNLPAGSHQIEIRPNGSQPIAFDVNVQGGQTMSVHADVR